MQTLTHSTVCPVCGLQATITLREDRDPIRGTEGHSIELDCVGRHAAPSDAQLLKLWAAKRVRAE